MKNLKKVLALVLVVALMMGFATVAGAADFTDSADVDHTEAVEVMTAIGVINGYPDGSFRPDGNVTRAQMAKMVAYIVSGGEDVGDLYAGATTFSDCLTHWARGYIAYANTTGIIAGVGNGRFNPDGNVTGAQAAKMMLCALGYKQDTEGYTGTGWSVNVLADARTVGLLDGLNGVNMNAALSRENAAQLMFNALKATMVEYPRGNTIVNGGDGTTVIIGGSEATYVGNSASKDYRVSGGDAYMQMCEYYFEDLELNAGSPDDFGRPANKWEYKNDAIGTYAKEADATYTAEVKSKDIYSDLGLSRTTTATVTEDGADKGSFSIARNNSTDKLGGNGVLVEAFVDDDKNVDLVVINTYVGEISAVYEDADDPYSTIAPLTGSEFVTDTTFETTAFDEDDVVLYTVADGEIQSVALAEKVSDLELTSTTGNTKFVADGTTYTYNKTATPYGGNLKDSIDVYLDTYGYVVYVKQYEAGSGNYAFVLGVANTEDKFTTGEWTHEAKLLLMDGTVVVADLKDSNSETTYNSFKNSFVSYTVDDDDVYTLYTKNYNSAEFDQIDLTSGTSSFDINGSGNTNGGIRYANNNTIFLVHDTDADEYTVYTGIKNVPSMSGAAKVYINSKTSGANGVAEIVFISGKSSVVSNANNALVYIIKKSESGLVKDSDRGNYYTYDAVIDGEITTIDVAADKQLSADMLASKLTYNSKNVVTNIDPYGNQSANQDDYAISGEGTKKTADGTVGLTASGVTTYYTYSDDVAVFRIEDNDFKAASVTSIRDDNDDTWSAVVKDGEVVAIFITTVGTNTPGKDDPADASVEKVTFNGQTGNVQITLNAAAAEDTTYTLSLEVLQNGNYVELTTFTITVKKGEQNNYTSIVSNLVAGDYYRITCGGKTATGAYNP